MKKVLLVVLTTIILLACTSCDIMQDYYDEVLSLIDSSFTQDAGANSEGSLTELSEETIEEAKTNILEYIEEISISLTESSKETVEEIKNTYFEQMENNPYDVSTLENICLLKIELVFLDDENELLENAIFEIFNDTKKNLELEKKRIEREGYYEGSQFEYNQELAEIKEQQELASITLAKQIKYAKYQASDGALERLLANYESEYKRKINSLNAQKNGLETLWKNKLSYENVCEQIENLESDRDEQLENLDNDYNDEVSRIEADILSLEEKLN